MAAEGRQCSPGWQHWAGWALPCCPAQLHTPLTCQVKQMVLRALVTVTAKMDGFPGWMDFIWEFVLELGLGVFSYQRKKFISFDSSLLRASFLYWYFSVVLWCNNPASQRLSLRHDEVGLLVQGNTTKAENKNNYWNLWDRDSYTLTPRKMFLYRTIHDEYENQPGAWSYRNMI